MTSALKLMPLAALLVTLTFAGTASAQHSMRQGGYGYAPSYRGAPEYMSDGCSSCNNHSTCGSCSRCINLCLPSPCAVVDKIGTALGGLRELFRCRCCYDNCGGGCRTTCGCSDCGGTMEAVMGPYSDPYMGPQKPTTTSEPMRATAPTPAQPTMPSAHNSPLNRSKASQVTAKSVRAQRYPRAAMNRPTLAAPIKTPSTVQHTSYKVPVIEGPEPVEAPVKRNDNPLR